MLAYESMSILKSQNKQSNYFIYYKQVAKASECLGV